MNDVERRDRYYQLANELYAQAREWGGDAHTGDLLERRAAAYERLWLELDTRIKARGGAS